MAKIKLTESKLQQIVSETVKKVLSELDWRTYASAAQKSEENGDTERSNKFRQAAQNSFNRQNGYGLKNVPYGDNKGAVQGDINGSYAATITPQDMSTYARKNDNGTNQTIFTPNIKGSKIKSGDVVGSYNNTTDNFNTDKNLVSAQQKGDKQVRDFYSGKSNYISGKGWS